MMGREARKRLSNEKKNDSSEILLGSYYRTISGQEMVGCKN